MTNPDDRSELIDSTKAALQRLGGKYGFETDFSDDVISLLKILMAQQVQFLKLSLIRTCIIN